MFEKIMLSKSRLNVGDNFLFAALWEGTVEHFHSSDHARFRFLEENYSRAISVSVE